MSIKSLVSFSFTCAAVTALVGVPALAADPAVKCESGKLKESGKYSLCRLKADSKAVSKGVPVDYLKCEAKFAGKWTKIEDKAQLTAMSNACPSLGDQASMGARVTTDAAEIATLLAGGVLPGCGNNVMEGNESCDGTDIGIATCQGLGFASGTLGCTAGCGFDVSPCVSNPAPGDCGNGVIDAGEDCDFGDLGGATCVSQGASGSGLICGVGCVFDTSGCVGCPTKVYDIALGDYGNSGSSCDGAGIHRYNGCGTGVHPYFTWVDTASAGCTATNVSVEYVEGVGCTAGTFNVLLNGTNQTNWTRTDDCICTPASLTPGTSSFAPSIGLYTIGGSNTVTFEGTSCNGFSPLTGSSNYARITVVY